MEDMELLVVTSSAYPPPPHPLIHTLIPRRKKINKPPTQMLCTISICRWITSSPVLEEINLDHNLIGDGGARELLQGLQQRKEVGRLPMKLTITVLNILPDTFQKIIELSTPKKAKRKARKKVCSCVLTGPYYGVIARDSCHNSFRQ